MNHYKFDEIEIGMVESFHVKITNKIMKRFRDITGDLNPLHISKKYALKKGYSSNICYGLLTASFLSTLAGVYLPGEHSLIHSIETKFVKPVFPGDVLLISGEVIEKNPSFFYITIKVIISNDKKEKVLKGIMRVGVLEDGR